MNHVHTETLEDVTPGRWMKILRGNQRYSKEINTSAVWFRAY